MGKYAELVFHLNPEGRRDMCDDIVNLLHDDRDPEELELLGDPVVDAIASTLWPEQFPVLSEAQDQLHRNVLRNPETTRQITEALGELMLRETHPQADIEFCAALLGVDVIKTPQLALSN